MPAAPAAVLAAVALATIAGCSGGSTSVRVVADADAEVRARAVSVRVSVSAGTGEDRTEYVETRAVADVGWPVDLVVLPRGGDPSRAVTFEIAALDAAGALVSHGGGALAFVRGAHREAKLVLTMACSAAPCAPMTDEPDASIPPAADAGPPPPSCVPQPESCDGRDEDCDGIADESVTRPCGGRDHDDPSCRQVCTAGDWGQCRRDDGERCRDR